ncbi:hypothetical protein YK48G_13930 [Lentilactobacillus fungorum]|jgi:hypothetical protein|uniref:AbrB family transcriptional regulator n=1 Tax=Lentilactobacillus fungorum TaxID=2201250 RepID=A0ABQ3VYJ6_9LACO|nr:hypothetical protein [Lentilactobacillus fungorum]GHP13968.1 hypothetical protein YK48G_13930 [Lentilactobacillus fungorum]
MSVKIQSINHMNAFLLPATIQPQAKNYHVFQADDGVILLIPVPPVANLKNDSSQIENEPL